MRVAISGINGRMGNFVYRVLNNREGYDVIYGIDEKRDSVDIPIYEGLRLTEKIDMLIDFSTADFARRIISEALSNGIMVISGTTGLTKDDLANLKKKSIEQKVSLIWVPNFAQGAAVMYDIIGKIKGNFQNYDILETHNIKKIDRPSGTAKEYADLLKVKYQNVQSLRLNEVIASHEVVFNNPGEKLAIKHEINFRDAFLKGFLQALNHLQYNEYAILIGLKDFYNFCM